LLGRGSFKYGQTNPPSKPLNELFPNGGFPEGEIQKYKDEYVQLFVYYFENQIVIYGEQQVQRRENLNVSTLIYTIV
jgi:hypothetical protein